PLGYPERVSRHPLVLVLVSLAVAGGLAVGLWRRGPVPPPPPPPAGLVELPPGAEPDLPESPFVRVDTVDLGRGDTLVRALARAGFDRPTADEITRRLKKSGANLKRVRPDDSLTITWADEHP